jgi:hypothetical protein
MEITVTFNQPMVPLQALPSGDGSGPLVITPPVKGKYRWKGPATLVFTPSDTLTLASEFRVRVPAGTKSLSGALLPRDEAWSFATLRPQLAYSSPSSGATHVTLAETIRLYFNQPMDAARARGFISVSSVDRASKKTPLAVAVAAPPEKTRQRYGDRRNMLLLTPQKAMPAGPTFTANDFSEAFWPLLKHPADSVSRYLAGQFGPAARRQLESYDPSQPAGLALRIAVTDELNRIIAAGPVYSPARFAAVKLNQGTRNLAAQDLNKENRARLNRLLLTKAYEPYLDRTGRLPQESRILVELARGLPSAAGTLGLAQPTTVEFSTYNFFRVAGVSLQPDRSPSSQLSFEFSNPVTAAALYRRVTISPPAPRPGKQDDGPEEPADEYDGPDGYASTTPQLRYDLKPDTEYRVTVSGALRDGFGQALGSDAVFTVRTGSYHPAVYVPGGTGVLESALPARLQVVAMNWDRVGRKLANVPTDGVVPLLRRQLSEGAFRPGTAGGVDDVWDLKVTRNVQKRLPLELSPVLGAGNSGLVCYQLTGLPPREFSGDQWADTTRLRSVSGFVQVTNLGLTGKFSPDNILVWVTRLSDCRPVAGAKVELRRDDNTVAYTGTSDKSGLCLCPGWHELGIKPPQGDDESGYYYGPRPRVWVIASAGGDRAVLVSHWGMGIEPYEFGLSYDWDPKPLQHAGYLFTERGLYRAGEKVHIKGIFRTKRRGEWGVPSQRLLRLVIKDSRDDELVDQQLPLSDWGSLSYSLQLKPGAPSGYYSVSVAADSADGLRAYESFRVEAYKPATFEVTVTTGAPQYVAGDSLQAGVRARYLFGAPMARGKFTWAARLAPYDFTPPGHEGFIFGRGWWWDEDRDYGSLLASGEGELDDQGAAPLAMPLDLRGAASSMALTVEATATGADRTAMSGRRQAVVHRGEYYLGYAQNTCFVEAGKDLSLSLIAARPDGTLEPGRTVTAEIIRRQWISVRRAGYGGRYQWHSERRDSTLLRTSLVTGTGPVSLTYAPPRPGFYIFRLRSDDRRGNPVAAGGYCYATGAGAVAWEARNDDRIDLVADKQAYVPGERARIMVKSPYPTCTALLTVERELVLSQRVVKLTGSAPVIELPILPEHLPNVYVSVVLLRGRLATQRFDESGDDLSKPAFKIGYINLAVDPGSKRLTLAVASDKQSYLPRDSVRIDLTVRDARNQPAQAEVTLAVVDRGVLNLIDFATPDAFGTFYGPRPLSVGTAETRLHVIGQRNYGEKGENSGGGGGPDAGFRGDFQTTPFYGAAVYTDKDGRARAAFRLPDNLTSFKIMATAHTRASLFGAGEHTFAVAKPVLLLAALPRFLRAGDSVSAGVTVHNRTGRAQLVTVKASVAGAELAGPGQRAVTVQPDQPVEVTFTYRAPSVGQAAFRFSATAEGGSDGLEQSLPVLMPKLTETVALYEQTDGAATQALVVPADVWPDVGGLQVTTSSTAFVGLEASLDYLIRYPYGCLEQTMSGLMPMIMAHDLIVNFNLAPRQGGNIRAYVQSGIERVYAFQGEDGGFGLWTDSRYRDAYLTAYVLAGLYRARQKGYEVDQGVADRAAGYLRNALTRIDAVAKLQWPYSRRWRYSTMAYAAYATALWGKPDQQVLGKLYARRDSLNLYGRSLLLRALHHAAFRPDWQQELTQQLLNTVKVAPTTWHFEDAADASDCWVFYSDVVGTSYILSTLLETQGPFAGAEKVVRWLMEERKLGRWRSTHENVHVFTAMDDYLARYEKEDPDFTASIKVAGKQILGETFQGRELTARTTRLPLSGFAAGKQLPVEIAKHGPGRLYYGLRMTYAPRAPAAYRDEGFAVTKQIATLDGAPATAFAAGTVYRVTLAVTTTQQRHYVVLDDPLPAGFEPVNLGFATESDGLRVGIPGDEDEDGREWGWWWGGFNHVETYDDRVLCFADVLSSGTHRHSYLMRALTPGRFALPQTKAEEMYSPEVFGWIPDTVVEVR